jgi:predicted transcriptional regulator
MPKNNSSVGASCLTKLEANRKIRRKDPASIILENISSEGEMSIDELENKCASLDIDKDVIEKTIARLLEAGNVYFPAKGRIKKV